MTRYDSPSESPPSCYSLPRYYLGSRYRAAGRRAGISATKSARETCQSSSEPAFIPKGDDWSRCIRDRRLSFDAEKFRRLAGGGGQRVKNRHFFQPAREESEADGR